MGTTSASGTTARQQAPLDMKARIVKFENIEPLLLGCALEPSSKDPLHNAMHRKPRGAIYNSSELCNHTLLYTDTLSGRLDACAL